MYDTTLRKSLYHSRTLSQQHLSLSFISQPRKRSATVACNHQDQIQRQGLIYTDIDQFYWSQLLSSTTEVQFWHQLATFIKYCMKEEYHHPKYFKSILFSLSHRLRLSESDLYLVAYQYRSLDMQGLMNKDYTIKIMRLNARCRDPIANIQAYGYPLSMEQNTAWLSEAGVTHQVRSIFAYYFPFY